MFMRRLKVLAVLAFVPAIAGPPAAQAAPRAASEQQELVNAARAAFARLRDDPDLTGLREHEREARGFLIVPRAWRVGLVFGGSGGRGVLVSKGRTGEWNGPSFYSVGTASLGLQAGVDV